MNAAIRATTRAAIDKGWDVFGVRDGYAGLVENRLEALGPRDVGGILGRGGTFLGSARLPEFREPSVQARALDNLRTRGIDGLIVIGGNGSQAGALALSNLGLEVVGVASTIDNNLAGSGITIGVDTALNIALEAIDRLRVTASSHKRAFLVEVMGRNCGLSAPSWPASPVARNRWSSRRSRSIRIPSHFAISMPLTPGARPTRWWWWPKARSTTRWAWPSTSRSTEGGWASICASPPSVTCSGAERRAR